MPVTTDRSAGRGPGGPVGPGILPRPLTALASAALLAGTGVAVWLLPSGPVNRPWAGGPGPDGPARGGTSSRPVPSGPLSSGSDEPGSPLLRPGAARTEPPTGRPSGFVPFADVARGPSLAPYGMTGRERVRWVVLGHLVATGDGCATGWAGLPGRAGGIAARLGPLRAVGGEVGVVFGGPAGREPAAACADPERLAAAYRRAVGALGASYAAFEPSDSSGSSGLNGPDGPDGPETVLRRARAIAVLQREAAARGRPLTVGFALEATVAGLAPGDRAMLRSTRLAGVEIGAVDLLVPLDRAPTGRARLGVVAAAVRAAQPQVARALGRPASWDRIALSPVLTGPRGLTAAETRTLTGFTARNGLAWLSVREPAPGPGGARLLAGGPDRAR
ncbi:hypothetical protein AB0D67_37715 [Streptosporangium sp. NPDC048047]|uniref:hypothetical protein n=1 Tax=Streptosporangium sp. NPDC048047 TaxID=3155748 RepID=UPI0034161A56